MRILKISLLLLILPLYTQICFGQQKAAVMAGTFQRIQLGELWARIDVFIQQLQQNQESEGYVVIYPKKGSTARDLVLQERLAREINNRTYQHKDFDEGRVKIILSKEKGEFVVELWEVPDGAEKPFAVERVWAEKPPDLTKPFIFGTEYIEDYYSRFAPKRYANLIKNNPNLRGHVVIFNRSGKEGRAEAEEWLKIFTEEYKVPQSRLKIFFGRNKGNPDVEFWLVPEVIKTVKLSHYIIYSINSR